jgi:hypothetical protein
MFKEKRNRRPAAKYNKQRQTFMNFIPVTNTYLERISQFLFRLNRIFNYCKFSKWAIK